jgi:hypothetical protein
MTDTKMTSRGRMALGTEAAFGLPGGRGIQTLRNGELR